MEINTGVFCLVMGILLALGATVLTYIFVLPEGKIKKFEKIATIIRDIFNFRSLYLEKFLQALYILCTIACITIGAMMIFGFNVWDSYYGGLRVEWYGGWGLLLILVGPIVIRVAYEVMMMGVLLVKNTIEINNKMKSDKKD